jgi:hypothetical protein
MARGTSVTMRRAMMRVLWPSTKQRSQHPLHPLVQGVLGLLSQNAAVRLQLEGHDEALGRPVMSQGACRGSVHIV